MKIALASQFSDNDIYINAKLINKSIISLKGQADLICFGEAFCMDLMLYPGIMKRIKR